MAQRNDQIEALRAEIAALRADVERAGKNFIVLLNLIKESAWYGSARSGEVRPGKMR